MTTKEIINKALEVMNGQDWYWYKAYGTMRYFVELVASINDSTIRKAMRELWTVTYNYMGLSSPMSSPTDIQTKEYNDRKAELMAVILPSRYNLAA